MEIEKTPIDGLLVIHPRVFPDSRGFFFESYNEKVYNDAGIMQKFVQDNISKSTYGVLRGLHYQLAPYSQSKLVQVIEGKVLDVAVDLRKSSATYGEWYGVELSGDNHTQFLIPRGFAHGFAVLSDTAVFTYKCDNLYTPAAERGIRYDDPQLNIDWKLPIDIISTSEKDQCYPFLAQAETNF